MHSFSNEHSTNTNSPRQQCNFNFHHFFIRRLKKHLYNERKEQKCGSYPERKGKYGILWIGEIATITERYYITIGQSICDTANDFLPENATSFSGWWVTLICWWGYVISFIVPSRAILIFPLIKFILHCVIIVCLLYI